ncbi:MAG: hypothetical protein RMJ55_14945, partial [Roseiflexaceae bacterium]|nr:hypothetical protein [Roseiflexaceae bacterium]
VGALRRSAIEPFTAPYWMTIITVLSVALIIYAIYYARTVYPGRLAAWEASQRGRAARAAARPQPTQRAAVRESTVREEKVPTNGAAPRPSGSRRAARREHKKRNK